MILTARKEAVSMAEKRKIKEGGPEAKDPRQIAAILEGLNEYYPDATCSLTYSNALQLLVATVLSAQCTDERVNRVTPALFERFPDAGAFAEAALEELEEAVRSTGFFRNKAKNIKDACRALADRYQGQVPDRLEDLVQLPGIGRKTANVILGNAFGIPAITVDTHVARVSQRLGLSSDSDPAKIEQTLMKLIPQPRWTLFSHQLILHGRRICVARKPRCGACPLFAYCDYGRQRMAEGVL
jgi:endonuclease-3